MAQTPVIENEKGLNIKPIGYFMGVSSISNDDLREKVSSILNNQPLDNSPTYS